MHRSVAAGEMCVENKRNEQTMLHQRWIRAATVFLGFAFVYVATALSNVDDKETREPAVIVNERAEAYFEDWAACSDYAGFERLDGVGKLVRREWAAPLEGWVRVDSASPSLRGIMVLPSNSLRAVQIPTRPSPADSLVSTFLDDSLMIRIQTFPTAGSKQELAGLEEFLEDLRTRGVDTTSCRKRIEGLTDLEVYRAEAQASCEHLVENGKSVDDSVWLFHLRFLRGSSLGEDHVCREMNLGHRTVLCYSKDEIAKSHFVRFRVFNRAALEYDVTLIQRYVRSNGADYPDDQTRQTAERRFRQICCGITALAFLGDKSDVPPDVRVVFESALGKQWVQQALGEDSTETDPAKEQHG